MSNFQINLLLSLRVWVWGKLITEKLNVSYFFLPFTLVRRYIPFLQERRFSFESTQFCHPLPLIYQIFDRSVYLLVWLHLYSYALGLAFAISTPEPHLTKETLISLLTFNLIFIYNFVLCDIFGRVTLSSCMQWGKQEGKCFRTDLFVEVILKNVCFLRPKLLAFPAFQ